MDKNIKKPKNHKDGDLTKMKKTILTSIPQIVFIITLIVWVVSASIISGKDILSNEFEHIWLSFSFIVGMFTTGYLTIVNYVKNIKRKPKKTCKKCGDKSKTKK
jgi:hypothetical protein